MTAPRDSLACPWCAHETADGNDFRTHLMVEHRKSELAAYVLDSVRSVATEEDASDDDSRTDDSDLEAELLAR